MNRQNVLSAAAVSLWVIALAAGFSSLWNYSNRAGDPGKEVSRWPLNSSIPIDSTRGNLVLFLHPRCPCSQATLADLARLLPRLHGRAVVTIVFSRPAGTPEGWDRGSLWSEANSIPGTRVISDFGEHLSSLFGAETSGMAEFYDGSGRLLYRGGLTPGRGHEGDNFGSDAVAALARGNPATASPPRAPVFGCALHSERRGS